jgi:hypothetical protein
MGTSREFRVTIALRVEDAGALWDAAAAQAMSILGMTLDDVAETIGDRAAPQIEDCLTLLADPMRYAGCTPTIFTVDADLAVAPATVTPPLRPRATAPVRRRAIRAADATTRVACIAPL